MLRIAHLSILGLVALAAGCTTKATSTEFAEGAFPPTLTDMEYHRNPWARTDCLACHAAGVNDAPKMEHVSLPPLAEEAKCRTCHVLVPGDVPAK